jgi:hypothetical protein
VSQAMHSWTSASIDHLLQMRVAGVGWGYRGDGSAYSEPTAMGCLALLSANDDEPVREAAELVAASADWLVELQQPDGAVGISAELSRPRWPTAYAALLWSQLTGYEQPLARSLRWLQQREGHTFVKTKECVLGHDTSIPGWPWVAGTHPWLEPTGMAMLALCRNQLAGHQRIRDGVRLILDRAIVTGGWNVGNSSVFGKPLRSQGGPTGIALLALRAAWHDETPTVTRACQYLLETLPLTRSPETLGWGLLGLRAWRPEPDEADSWVGESFSNALALKNSPLRLSTLILAASSTSLARLGVQPAYPAQASMETVLS